MRCRRGDVVLVLFPDSNLRTAKRRPALVVQRNELNTGLSQTIVAMVTSNMARVGHPSRIGISPSTVQGRDTGLKTNSVVMTDNLVTLLDVEIDRVIGFFNDKLAIDSALKHTLGI